MPDRRSQSGMKGGLIMLGQECNAMVIFFCLRNNLFNSLTYSTVAESFNQLKVQG